MNRYWLIDAHPSAHHDCGQMEPLGKRRCIELRREGARLPPDSAHLFPGSVESERTADITQGLYVVMTERWHWRKPLAITIVALLLVIDLSFLGASALKLLQGGWVTLASR